MADETESIEDVMNNNAKRLFAYLVSQVKKRREAVGPLADPAAEHVEMKFLDDDRYHEQEKVVMVNARIPASVSRFVSCCMALCSGFKIARHGDIDFDVAKCHWLSACLELMCESVLKVEKNDWKTSLTVTDGQLIHRYFTAAAGAMIDWLVEIQHAEPLADLYMFGPFAEGIHRLLINGHVEIHDGEQKVAIAEGMVLKTSVGGNLQVSDLILNSLLSSCTVRNAADEYRKGPCPTELCALVEVGLTNTEFDHTWRCLEGDGKLHECWHKLYARYDRFGKAESDAERRALFTFEPTENIWFDYYVREYCTPTPYHAKYVDEDWLDAKALVENISYVEEITEKTCLYVVKCSHSSPQSLKAQKAWQDLAARFKMRCLNGAAPSYAEQRKFCTDLSDFMGLFAAAVQTIGTAPAANAASASAPTSEPKQDLLSSLVDKMDGNSAMLRKMMEMLKRGTSDGGNPPVPRSGAVELLQKVMDSVKSSLEAAKKGEREAAYDIFNNKEAKDAINKLFRGGFELGQTEAAEIGRLWYETRTVAVDYLGFLSRRGVKGAEQAVGNFEARNMWEISERLIGHSHGASQLRVAVTKELYCCFVDRPLVKEGDFSAANLITPKEWSKWKKVGLRFKCDVDNEFANVADYKHTADSGFPGVELYLGMAETAREIVRELIEASALTKPDDWWITSKYKGKSFSGYFQTSDPPARRFHNDQIEVGTNNNHKGKWRILPDVMFKDRYLKNHPKTDPLKDS